ncbi:hypothetical protein C1H46_000395 [Malus baccata]|uniref:Protein DETOXIFICATION n=1 Tax=Malus baccata TaxID=106549 RepID=A0A540NTJ6_MALBA|nr:hypothetical protein C1H46_000395 [Malus baccata]
MIVTTGTATLLHLFICWLLVYKTSLGCRGAAMANCIAYWINALLFLEMWCFEMMVLLSRLLPNPTLETSVLSISLNTSALTYMIPLGLAGAASTRVSNEFGARRPRLARPATFVTLFMVATEGIVAVAVIILGQKVWGYCSTTKKEVVDYVGEILPWVAISHFIDGIQSVLSGAYYQMGIPTAVLLAFVLDIGGKGLWIGITVALFVQALCLSIIITCTDWEKEVKKASDRVYKTMAAADAV